MYIVLQRVTLAPPTYARRHRAPSTALHFAPRRALLRPAHTLHRPPHTLLRLGHPQGRSGGAAWCKVWVQRRGMREREYREMRDQQEDDKQRRFDYYLMEGNSAHNAQDWEGALKNYRLALAINSHDYNVYAYIAAVYEAKQEWLKVTESSRLAIALATKYKADHIIILNEHVRMGRAYQHLNRLRDSWRSYLEAQLLAFSTSPTLPELIQIQEEMKYKSSVKVSSVKELTLVKAYSKEFIGNLPVEIRLAEEKGRGLFATKDFKVGEVVLIEEPFITCPDYRNTEPNFCLSTLRPLYQPELLIQSENDIFSEIPEAKKREVIDDMINQLKIQKINPVTCKTCGIVKFSNEETERRARDTYLSGICDNNCHKNPQLKFLLPSIFNPQQNIPFTPETETLKLNIDISTMELLTLFLSRVNKDLDLWDKFAKFLVTIEEQPPRPLTDIEAKYLSILTKMFPDLDYLLSERSFLRLKSMISLNAFSIEASGLNLKLIDESKKEALKVESKSRSLSTDAVLSLIPSGKVVCGAALYKVASFMNHSCTPNCHPSVPSVSAAQVFLAVKPIKKGEELTCSYLSEDMDPWLRREMLAIQYGFDCNGACEACVEKRREEQEQEQEQEQEEMNLE